MQKTTERSSAVAVLADGTTLDDLIDVRQRRVSTRVHSDPLVFKLEQGAIFMKSWIALAHETEIRNPGDFVTRNIAGDSVIVVRERDGGVAVLLNSCAHRGMAVCRAERGSTTSFRCPFHAWTYALDGQLVGVPFERELYGGRRDRGPLGLRRARTGIRAGMIFACWDPLTPELDEYLGEMGWYLDAGFARTKGGLEVAGPPQRWIFPGNWKMGSEQFAGDSYHVESLHKFAFELGYIAKSRDTGTALNLMIEGGHSARVVDLRSLVEDGDVLAFAKKRLPLGMTPELVDEAAQVLSPEQFSVMACNPPLVGTVFPNFSFIQFPSPDAAGRTGSGALSFTVFNPIAPGRMEILAWPLVERDAPVEEKRALASATVQTFSVSGVFEQDDTEAWSSAMDVLQGPAASERWLDYASDATGYPVDLPGTAQGGTHSDNPVWNFWLEWRNRLLEGA